MGSSNRCTLTTITVFHIAFFLSFLFVRSAEAIPTADDINSLAEKLDLLKQKCRSQEK